MFLPRPILETRKVLITNRGVYQKNKFEVTIFKRVSVCVADSFSSKKIRDENLN